MQFKTIFKSNQPVSEKSCKFFSEKNGLGLIDFLIWSGKFCQKKKEIKPVATHRTIKAKLQKMPFTQLYLHSVKIDFCPICNATHPTIKAKLQNWAHFAGKKHLGPNLPEPFGGGGGQNISFFLDSF